MREVLSSESRGACVLQPELPASGRWLHPVPVDQEAVVRFFDETRVPEEPVRADD
jgi:hypothetical protein